MTEKEFILPLEKEPIPGINQTDGKINSSQEKKQTQKKGILQESIGKNFRLLSLPTTKKKHKRVHRILFRNCR